MPRRTDHSPVQFSAASSATQYRCARAASALVLAVGLAASAQTPTFTSPVSRASQQAPGSPARTASGPGLDITGRDFAGLRLSLPIQRGTINLKAARATTWAEDAPGLSGTVSGQTVGDSVQRISLAGDVRIDLGGSSFSSTKAVLWLESLRPASGTTPALWQVALHLDRVGDAAGEHGVQQTGDRLLVTAVVEGELQLAADSLRQGRPDGDIFLTESERRLARFLTAIASGLQSDNTEVGGDGTVLPPEPKPWEMAGQDSTKRSPVVPGLSRPFEPDSPITDSILRRRPATARNAATSAKGTAGSPLFSRTGVITIAAGEPVLVPGIAPGESALLITGGVVVQYTERRSDRTLQLTAQQAVIFLSGEKPTELFRTSADKVLGVYLEGDVVATDGKYTIRSPRVFYDVKNGTGSMADAVFWTFDEKQSLPLYVRAKSLRQVSSSTFEATDAKLATSAFFTPHLSIGAQSVTVTRDVPPGAAAQNMLAARGVTGRLGGTPFFYWPGFEGNTDDFPLREVGFTSSSGNGYGLKTKWNLWGLAGIASPIDGLVTDLLFEAYTKRGFAAGIDTTLSNPNQAGNLFAYMVPDDRGIDEMPNGARIENSGEFRGIAFGAVRQELDEGWTAFIQGAVISDERFTDAYFRNIAETQRELTNAGQLRYLGGNAAFALTGKFSANDFVTNHYLLQSQGYSSGKLPEVRYTRIGDDVLSEAAPGLLMWNQEYRAGALQLRFNEPTNSEMGYRSFGAGGAPNSFISQQAFGLNANQSIGDQLRARGYTDDAILRADTRQELVMALQYGPVKVEPFLTGRATIYDHSFDDFAAAAGSQDTDSLRLWGGAGAKVGTSMQKVDKSVRSDVFDVDGTRHIIEPSVTMMTSGTTRDAGSLPIYDNRVENLMQGNIVRGGVTQTWQTLRGGPGRQHTVDFFKLSTDVVWSEDSTTQQSPFSTTQNTPIGRFVDYRPEYSVAGKFVLIDGVWQATDSAAISAGTVLDNDDNLSSATYAGIKLDHSVDFSTFAEVRNLTARSVTYVDFGGQFRLTTKYITTAYATYDTNRSEIQSVTAKLNREFPDLTLGIGIRYDQITDDVSLSVDFRPLAQDTRRGQLQRLRGTRIDPGVGEIPDVQTRQGWLGK